MLYGFVLIDETGFVIYAPVGFLIVLGLLWVVAKRADRFLKRSDAVFFLQEVRLSHSDFDLRILVCVRPLHVGIRAG